jgi:hypothetical protein
MNAIELTVVWTDDDQMLKLGVHASNHAHSVYHETYVYPDALAAFGEKLKAFPQTSTCEVTIECGSREPRFHDYIRLHVFVLKPTGQSALEIESEIRGSPPLSAESRFFISGVPADFNRLGSELVAWVKNPDRPLRAEWQND